MPCRFLILWSLLILVPGCRSASGPTQRHPPERALVRLDDGLEPVRASFNAERGKPRFIALLSPT